MESNDFEECAEEIRECESPIEQQMFLALKQLARQLEGDDDCWAINILTQYPVRIGNSCYRADLLARFGYIPTKTIINILVECDGHDFHEKTKEQAARDKKRDRSFAREGLTVLRFTGSEIFNNPEGCAREVSDLVKARINGL